MLGALIGFGTIAMGHLAAYQQLSDVTIAAIVDPSPDRRIQATISYPTIRTYESVEALMVDMNVDFIDICSPPHTHREYIYKGLINNCHVLCEKPFLLSVNDYKGLLSLTKNANRVLYPCHNYKFAPVLRLLKDKVQSGNFGEIIGGHFRTLRSGHAVGVPEWNPHWRRDSTVSGGGILRDHGTHSIYMASHICGLLPNSVSCLIGNLRNNGYEDTEDTALLTLHFEDDLRFIIDLSWAASFRSSYYAIYGTNENIVVENDKIMYTARDGILVQQSLPSEFDDPSHRSWFVDLHKDFQNLITSPERQVPLLQEALVTSLVIEQAYLSAQQGGDLLDVPYPSEGFL